MRWLRWKMWRMLGVQDEKLIRVAREKDKIIEMFRQKGMRVTKQRRLILDIVFEHECTCCKEIYYQASRRDKNIGIATVYRMVNALTDLGVFRVNVPYYLSGDALEMCRKGCSVVMKNQSVVDLEPEEWQRALEDALTRKGYSGCMEIDRVILK